MTGSSDLRRQKLLLLRAQHEIPQALGLGQSHLASERRQPVRAAALGAAERRLPDPPVGEQAFDDAVERPGAEHDLTVRARLNFLQDGVAVLFTVGERQQHVKKGGRQWTLYHGVPRYVVSRHSVKLNL